MVSPRYPRTFDEFVASQGLGVPPVKGMTPAGRNDMDASGYDVNTSFRPSSTYVSASGESGYLPQGQGSCPSGYRFIDGVCVFNGGGEGPSYMPRQPNIGPAAGCPQGYALAADGSNRCVEMTGYAP